MTEAQIGTERAPSGPPPPASLDSLFGEGSVPPGIAGLPAADRDDLLSLVQSLHHEQIAGLIATGPKMLDALPFIVRKAIQKMMGSR